MRIGQMPYLSMARGPPEAQDGVVADLPSGSEVLEDGLDLPLYVLDDEREARHRLRQLGTTARGQWRALASAVPSTNPWPTIQRQPLVPQMPAMLVVTRVIDLAPDTTLAAFDDWWADAGGPVRLVVGGDELEVVRPHRRPATTSCLLRVRTRLHHATRWVPPQRLDLEVVSWSTVRTELDLRPIGPIRRTHHFFAVGHDLLSAVAAQLFARCGAPMPDAPVATPAPSAFRP